MTVLGILAHVDAGKTTLSENILYRTGVLKKAGRVDNGDTCLDTHEIERQRGITVFSSSAQFTLGGKNFTLLDTPGHADFSAEMERTLSVIDYAVLVVSGVEGVQGHTKTLARLLDAYHIPAFIFVNKMDYSERSHEELIGNLSGELGLPCVDFTEPDQAVREENIAVCDDVLLERVLGGGNVSRDDIISLIQKRKMFPVCFGSALKDEGVESLLNMIAEYSAEPKFGPQPDVRVFKITHDRTGARQTHVRVTGGTIRIKDKIGEEKINAIRRFSGARYEEITEAGAGEIVALMGVSAKPEIRGLLTPVMTYRVFYPDSILPQEMLENLRILEEESPELSFGWNEEHGEIHVKVMGEVQLEILKSIVKDRFGAEISFGQGSIVYKETIADTVEGVGHFEPLRHYAEVHLLMEPGARGSGITIASDVSDDSLAKNWQRLILTHLAEREHKGVLTGSGLTDVKITLKAGRAHLKHTEGGDFRQATYRAVRQGLMKAENVLLEPFYDFTMKLPQECVGRAMKDIDRFCGSVELMPDGSLCGYAPVSCLWDYQNEITAYTRGNGSISLSLRGYDVCHNTEEVLEKIWYDPEADLRNPTGSVFCEHGAGVYIPWNEVEAYMHVPSIFGIRRDDAGVPLSAVKNPNVGEWLDSDEVDAIIKKLGGANRKNKERPQKKVLDYNSAAHSNKPRIVKPKYLLIDGYNIIFAWDELKELAAKDVDAARLKLMDIVSNYAGYREIATAVVFDAYRLQNHRTEEFRYHNISIVFTATAETADHYIERFTHENSSKYEITVATSDGVEQIIIRSQGCYLMSAANFYEEVKKVNETISELINGSV